MDSQIFPELVEVIQTTIIEAQLECIPQSRKHTTKDRSMAHKWSKGSYKRQENRCFCQKKTKKRTFGKKNGS